MGLAQYAAWVNSGAFGADIQERMLEESMIFLVSHTTMYQAAANGDGRYVVAFYSYPAEINRNPKTKATITGSMGEIDPSVADACIDVLNYNTTLPFKVDGVRYKGIATLLGYANSIEDYESVDWVQSVFNTYEGGGWHNDLGDDNDNAPFYYTQNGDDRQGITGLEQSQGYEKMFSDGPGYPVKSPGTYTFCAETSLVGLKDGTYQNIVTVRWGFLFTNGAVSSFMKMEVVPPNNYQQSLIDNLNNR